MEHEDVDGKRDRKTLVRESVPAEGRSSVGLSLKIVIINHRAVPDSCEFHDSSCPLFDGAARKGGP